MIYFNIIANNDEIDDMNDNKMVYPSDNLTNDVYGNTNHQNVQQEQTTQRDLDPRRQKKREFVARENTI